MKVCFLGNSHAAQHISKAAAGKGFQLVALKDAELVFVSQDTPTIEDGTRDLAPIRELIRQARTHVAPIVLTSQVPPGFTRGLGIEIWHQAETLRIGDAEERAAHPEMIIVGCENYQHALPSPYWQYLQAFKCVVLTMTWEEAEFSKIAINMMLAAQVDATNKLAAAAERIGARWAFIVDALRHDSRIGPYAYLNPGRWEDSPHLLRDAVTLRDILS